MTPGAPSPPGHLQTGTVALGPPNLLGERVAVQGLASLALCEAANTTIQKADLNFTKSPGPPCGPPLGQEPSTLAGNHYGMRVMGRQGDSVHTSPLAQRHQR